MCLIWSFPLLSSPLLKVGLESTKIWWHALPCFIHPHCRARQALLGTQVSPLPLPRLFLFVAFADDLRLDVSSGSWTTRCPVADLHSSGGELCCPKLPKGPPQPCSGGAVCPAAKITHKGAFSLMQGRLLLKKEGEKII